MGNCDDVHAVHNLKRTDNYNKVWFKKNALYVPFELLPDSFRLCGPFPKCKNEPMTWKQVSSYPIESNPPVNENGKKRSHNQNLSKQ